MHLEMVVLIVHLHLIGPPETGNVIGIGETKGLHHLGPLHLSQTVGSRAIRVHY